ncbi:cilia- and flagella-associated protein 45-like [Drosophila virilis]|uniref:cilia- and flagella-associated protein 45-like n=1 Tax=Drosophila virilis TaxID=7244 RepID=UPI00139616D6|nr:neurofilament heavy polypeptide [Drosophila virilis]
MKLNRACAAEPGHKQYKRYHIGLRPVVISAERYNGIVDRSNQKEKQEMLEAIEEEQRYRQYLKDGNDALMKRFKNLANTQGEDDDQRQAARDKVLAEMTKDQRAKKLLEQMRKERIMRANRILNLLKPGPRALHQGLLNSEMIYQRDYNQALKCEFAEDARRQQQLDEKQCPEFLIPFGHVTEEQEKAQQLVKMNDMRDYYLKDLEARRLRRQAMKEHEVLDCIVQREKYKCMQEQEEKAAKATAERKREFCRSAYREALKEKAEKAKFESMCDNIEERIICVDKTTHRNMDARFNKQTKDMRQSRIRQLEANAVQLCQNQQAAKTQLQHLQDVALERYATEVLVDEQRRKCEIKKLSEQRRQYELESKKRQQEKDERLAEIRRYQIVTRFKNDEANINFATAAKKQQDKVTADLRDILHGQRKEFLDQRQEELMRITACDEDPHLKDDVNFFEGAVHLMEDSKSIGRPLYPIAKAVAKYRKENQVDMVPEGQMVRRSKLRDACWPGYYSKAELAYRKYEHREGCRREQEKERHTIFNNCIKITKMASEESPYKRCTIECPMHCFQHRGLPAMESVQSMEMPGFICHEEELPPAKCPSIKEIATPCQNCPPSDGACLCPSVMQVMKPGEEYPPSEPKAPSEHKAPSEKTPPSEPTAPSEKMQPSESRVPSEKMPPSEPKAAESTLAKSESTLTKFNSKRIAAGKESTTAQYSINSGSTKRSTRKPALTRYWTAKPLAQAKAKIDPIASTIDLTRTVKSCPETNWSKTRKQFD